MWRRIGFIVLLAMGPGKAAGTIDSRSAAPFADDSLKFEIGATGLKYFLEHAHPASGLVRDRADNFRDTPASNRAASIAATGFGLAVVANSAVRGELSRAEAQRYVLRTLRFARDRVARFRGWFVHFVDWQDGARLWRSEYSTIDTALFMAGAMYAAQVFPENSEIANIAKSLYLEIDFADMMTDGGTKPGKRTMSMAYSPENGYTASQWDMYAEEMVLLLLGLAHPLHPLPAEAWLAWSRKKTLLPNGQEVMGLGEALFVHQYSQLFLDLRAFNDGFPNYHENSRLITAWHRQLAKSDTRFKTLATGFWGFSAGDSPSGYRVWSPLDYQGTVCVGCVIASVMFSRELVLQDLASWRNGPLREKVWGRYGFVDSLDLDHDWFGSEVLGITVGPAVLAVANTEPETSVWKDFMKIPEVVRGLEVAKRAGRP